MKLLMLIFAVAFSSIGCSSSNDNPPMGSTDMNTGCDFDL